MVFGEDFTKNSNKEVNEDLNYVIDETKSDLVEIKQEALYLSGPEDPSLDIEQQLKQSFFLGHSFVAGYPAENKFCKSGITVSGMVNKILKNPNTIKTNIGKKTLIVDLGINDRRKDINTFKKDYNTLLKILRENIGYTGKIHIIGISYIYKNIVIKNKIGGVERHKKEDINKRIDEANSILEDFCQTDPLIEFYQRDLGENVSKKDGIHPQNSETARNQLLGLVYPKKTTTANQETGSQ